MTQRAAASALALLILLTLVLLPLAGCRSSIKDDPILKLSGQEALEQGKQWLEAKKYARARKYLSHAFEVEPNSRGGREALLLVADTYFLQGGLTNYIQAESKYRDFLNRFPTSNQAAYAQFQVANSLAKRMEKPDRDQSSTLKAFNAYQELARLYPTSEYAEQATEQIRIVEQNLAEHELVVGRFNFRFKNYQGALERLEFLLEHYPTFSRIDEALYYLGLAYHKSRNPEVRLKALVTFQRLRTEFPDSKFAAQIPSLKPEETSAGAAEDEGGGATEEADG